MPPASTHSRATVFLVATSIFGLLTISALTFVPTIRPQDFAQRKFIIGSAFMVICLLGIIAVFFPGACSRTFSSYLAHKGRGLHSTFNHASSTSGSGPLELRGHHPTCGHFSSHVFTIAGNVFCATCSGLLLGASIVIGGIAAYFFADLQLTGSASVVVWVGATGVAVGLLVPVVVVLPKGIMRVLSGALLPIGAFMILVGVDQLAQDIFWDMFVVVLAVLWLMTRISLSRWEHAKACSVCSLCVCQTIG